MVCTVWLFRYTCDYFNDSYSCNCNRSWTISLHLQIYWAVYILRQICHSTGRPNRKATPMNFGKTKGKLSTSRGWFLWYPWGMWIEKLFFHLLHLTILNSFVILTCCGSKLWQWQLRPHNW